MFKFIKRIFSKKAPKTNDLYDKDGKLVEKSSVGTNAIGERVLKLDNDSCAMILHKGNNVEVVFTKFYNTEAQTITENEEALMAIAVFMKQPGFLEMLIEEFRKIAVENINNLTDNIEDDEK